MAKKKDSEVINAAACDISKMSGALAPISASGKIQPNIGINLDASMAVAYVTSARRKQLRAAKEAANNARKDLHKQIEELRKGIPAEIPKSAANVGADWMANLNTAFKAAKVELVAWVKLPDDVSSLDDKGTFCVTQFVSHGNPSKPNDIGDKRSHYRNDVCSEAVHVPANEKMADIFSKITKLESDIAAVTETEIKISRELSELQYTQMDTQAALFANTLRSDENGKAILATLDAQIAAGEVPQLPGNLGLTK